MQVTGKKTNLNFLTMFVPQLELNTIVSKPDKHIQAGLKDLNYFTNI